MNLLEKDYRKINHLYSIFLNVLNKIKELYNHDLFYIGLKISNIPENKHGDIDQNHIEKFAGCFVPDNNYIVINPEPEQALKFYNVEIKKKRDLDKFFYHIIAHELFHAVYQNFYSDEIKHAIEKIKEENFETSYLKKYKAIHKEYDEELFCEYMASRLIFHFGFI